MYQTKYLKISLLFCVMVDALVRSLSVYQSQWFLNIKDSHYKFKYYLNRIGSDRLIYPFDPQPSFSIQSFSDQRSVDQVEEFNCSLALTYPRMNTSIVKCIDIGTTDRSCRIENVYCIEKDEEGHNMLQIQANKQRLTFTVLHKRRIPPEDFCLSNLHRLDLHLRVMSNPVYHMVIMSCREYYSNVYYWRMSGFITSIYDGLLYFRPESIDYNKTYISGIYIDGLDPDEMFITTRSNMFTGEDDETIFLCRGLKVYRLHSATYNCTALKDDSVLNYTSINYIRKVRPNVYNVSYHHGKVYNGRQRYFRIVQLYNDSKNLRFNVTYEESLDVLGVKYYTLYPYEINSRFELFTKYGDEAEIAVVKIVYDKTDHKIIYVNTNTNDMTVDFKNGKVHYVDRFSNNAVLGVSYLDPVYLIVQKSKSILSNQITFHFDMGSNRTSPPLSIDIYEEYELFPYAITTRLSQKKQFNIFVPSGILEFSTGISVYHKKLDYSPEGRFTVFNTTARVHVYLRHIRGDTFRTVSYERIRVGDDVDYISECTGGGETCVELVCRPQFGLHRVERNCFEKVGKTAPPTYLEDKKECSILGDKVRVKVSGVEVDVQVDGEVFVSCSVHHHTLHLVSLGSYLHIFHIDVHLRSYRIHHHPILIYGFDTSRSIAQCSIGSYVFAISTSEIHIIDTFNSLQSRVQLGKSILDASCLTKGRILLEARGGLWIWDKKKENDILMLAEGSISDVLGSVQEDGFLLKSSKNGLHYWVSFEGEFAVETFENRKKGNGSGGEATLNITSLRKSRKDSFVFNLNFFSFFEEEESPPLVINLTEVVSSTQEGFLPYTPRNLQSVEFTGELKSQVEVRSPFTSFELPGIFGEANVINPDLVFYRSYKSNRTIVRFSINNMMSETTLVARGKCGPISRIKRTTSVGIALCDRLGYKYLSWFEISQPKVRQVRLQIPANAVNAVRMARNKYSVAFLEEERSTARFYNVSFPKSGKYISHTANFSKEMVLKGSSLL